MTTHKADHSCSAISEASVLSRCDQHGACELVVLRWSCGIVQYLRHGLPAPAPRRQPPRSTT